MSTKNAKRYLMLLMAVGVIAVSLSGGGTFASFNAEVANKNNTFVTGTLYLHQTDTNTCTSESSSSNSNLNTSGVHLGDLCDVLFSGVSATGYETVGLDMKDAGTLDGDGLRIAFGNTSNGFAQTGCVSSVDWEQVGSVAATNGFTTSGGTDGAGTFTDASAGDTITSIHLTAALGISLYSGAQFEITHSGNVETFTTTGIVSPTATTIPVVAHTTTNALSHSDPVLYSPQFSGGGGNLCSELRLQMVEVASPTDYTDVTFSSSTGNSASTDPNSKCVYDGNASPTTNANFGCDDANTSALNSLANYPSFTGGQLHLQDLSSTLGGNWDSGSPRDPDTATGLDAHTHRYLVLILYVAPNADNSVQGLKATFDLVWHMNQFTT